MILSFSGLTLIPFLIFLSYSVKSLTYPQSLVDEIHECEALTIDTTDVRIHFAPLSYISIAIPHGPSPAGMVATTLFISVSMTDTSLETPFAV